MATILGAGVAGATPAAADPNTKDLAAAQAKADRLYHEAEVASERYNEARDRLRATRRKLTSLNADLDRQQKTVDTMRSQVTSMMVSQYQNGALDTASQVVLSDDPDSFLNNLTAVEAYNTQRSDVLSNYATQLDRLKQRKSAVSEQMTSAASLEKQLGVQKKTIDAKAADAKEALAGIKAKMGPPTSAADVSVSGRAGAAVRFAMAQVGKAYVYGAAGPDAYDCSGLTMAAWAKAGVSLPHSSSAQYGSGQHISESQLQPGDLVFYYSPISHVGMYIGGGKIVNALNPSAGIRVSGLHDMPFSGAVRPGG